MKTLLFRLIDANGQIVGYEKWINEWCYAPPKAPDSFRPGMIPHVKKDPWTGATDKNKVLVYENDILQWSAGSATDTAPTLAVVTYTDYLTAFELRNDLLKIRCGVGLAVTKLAHTAPVVVGNMHEKQYAELQAKIQLYGGLPK